MSAKMTRILCLTCILLGILYLTADRLDPVRSTGAYGTVGKLNQQTEAIQQEKSANFSATSSDGNEAKGGSGPDTEKQAPIAPTKARDSLRRFQGETSLPDDLFQVYEEFFKTTRRATAEALAGYCLPGSIKITKAKREKYAEYGEGMNLPFLVSGFDGEISSVHKENVDSSGPPAGSPNESRRWFSSRRACSIWASRSATRSRWCWIVRALLAGGRRHTIERCTPAPVHRRRGSGDHPRSIRA